MNKTSKSGRRAFLLVRGAAVLGVLAAVTVAGCSSLLGGPDTISLRELYPTLGKSRLTRRGVSSLFISTPTWVDLNLASGDDESVVRPSGYTLYDDLGRKLEYVRNYIGTLDREPTTLELEPAKYLILLDQPGKLAPIFWVVVEPGRLTEVDLSK